MGLLKQAISRLHGDHIPNEWSAWLLVGETKSCHAYSRFIFVHTIGR